MNKTCRANKWLIGTLIALALLLAAFAGVCVYIDPFCHYHAPLSGYDYSIVAETVGSMYLNDGIIRHFDFDGVITGTSMTENFKPSEADELFGGKFIKVPLEAANYEEINTQIKRIYKHGKDPKYIIRSLDSSSLFWEKDKKNRDFSDAEYLYNDNPFDDVKYLFNFDVFTKYTVNVLKARMQRDGSPLDLDIYCRWDHPTGKDVVLASYTVNTADEKAVFTQEDKVQVLENIRLNITDIAYKHPETTFICFFPPYSICSWEKLNAEKTLNRTIEAQRTAAEELLKCPNIKLFGFDDQYDIICDLENYRDESHYCAAINSELLKMMSDGIGQLTLGNYEDYFDKNERFYSDYDYSWLRE